MSEPPPPCWVERKTAALVTRAMGSRWRREIFTDVRWLMADGYVPDVALTIALNYWEGP